jgi:hypothetical protein
LSAWIGRISKRPERQFSGLGCAPGNRRYLDPYNPAANASAPRAIGSDHARATAGREQSDDGGDHVDFKSYSGAARPLNSLTRRHGRRLNAASSMA